MELAHGLEFGMLFAFGFSWPFAIAKTLRAKRVDGKSPLFMIIVITGYLLGVAARILDADAGNNWLVWVYLADIALVSTDLALYFHYARRAKGSR